jgi:hypothetical protein
MGYKQKIIYDGNGNPEYMGEALPGMAESSSGWRIRKFTLGTDGGETVVTDVKFAGGSQEFNKVMDDYASYTYA